MDQAKATTYAPSPPLFQQVAALCAVLDKDLSDRRTTTEVDVDPLVSASYASLFSLEVERRLKQVRAPLPLPVSACHVTMHTGHCFITSLLPKGALGVL